MILDVLNIVLWALFWIIAMLGLVCLGVLGIGLLFVLGVPSFKVKNSKIKLKEKSNP